MKETRMSKWLLTLFYLLTFALLFEWLVAIEHLTETGYISLFLFFILFSFALAIYKVSWRYTIPIKAIYILWAVHFIYLDKILFAWPTMRILITDIFSNIAIIGSGDWPNITNSFRTILFYALIWMTTYLIQYWIETKRSILLFYMMTVVFIAFIDTFSNYSAGFSIVRVMVVGLFLLGLLAISKITYENQVKNTLKSFSFLVYPLLLILVISTLLIVYLPKQEPVWPDPVPYFVSLTNGEDGDGPDGGMSKSGYSADDSKLGGPFTEDDSVVFEAQVDTRQYWKIETKTTYTSKGWEQSVHENNRSVFDDDLVNDIVTTVESDEVKTAKLTMAEMYPFLIYPYDLTRIITTQNASFIYYFDSSQYLTRVDSYPEPLESYEMEFLNEKVSLKSLRETKMSDLDIDSGLFTDPLQLPDELPERVYELANSITESSESVYDKAKAIERYFGKSGFMYNKKDVAVPEEEEDYVDQFLFETKKGYCDNFSSSMVVMLRTVGIPARWVKGFAPGEQVKNPTTNERVYEVTNNEAHSWVEAYMPGIGWLPFEPTIGFSGQTRIDYDLELDLDDPEIEEMPAEERKEIEKKKPKEITKTNNSKELGDSWKVIGSWVTQNKWLILLISSALILLGLLTFIKRRKWLPKILVSLYKSDNQDWASFEKRYKSLLQQLKRYGVERRAGETLSSYATKVDERFGGQKMKELTFAYEKGIYGEDLLSHDWQRLQKLWEDLMNMTVD